ncbi:hypothetical protein D3C77_480450 [compost metagenome]
MVAETDPYGPRDAEGWYTWNGDETMRPAGRVDYVTRKGFVNEGANAGSLRWVFSNSQIGFSEDNDIVKWRPAQ